MTNLFDGQITDLLNNSMKYNPETIAMGHAVLQEKRRIMEQTYRTRLLAFTDTLGEKVLDHLAVELRTPSYSENFPIGVKRQLIAGTLPFYAKLGTPVAVNWIIRAIFGEGQMEDWYQYGGMPYHFRIQSSAPIIATGGVTEFLQALESVKRLSSWLDEIILEIASPPFVETSGRLIFQRFTQSWTFSNRRGGLRFNGAPTFDGTITFDQDGGGTLFQRFNFGTAFEQPFRTTTFPTLRINAQVRHEKSILSLLRFRAASTFLNSGNVEISQIKIAVRIRQNGSNLCGNLTADNWTDFSGENTTFDGTTTFNAYIKEEEL